MAPVILQMDVHCLRCARKIRKAIEHLHGKHYHLISDRVHVSIYLTSPFLFCHAWVPASVDSVWASPETGPVFVAGTADASTVQWLIESKMRKPITIVSDGERCYPTYTRMEHLGPQQGYRQPPPAAYSPYYAAIDRQHMPNGAPVYFNDENPRRSGGPVN